MGEIKLWVGPVVHESRAVFYSFNEDCEADGRNKAVGWPIACSSGPSHIYCKLNL